MKVNQLFMNVGIDPKDVSIITHTSNLWPWRNWLPHVAAEHPELFAAYQSVHSDSAALTLKGRPLAASFVPVAERLSFAGLYRVKELGRRTVAEIYADERFSILETRFGATDTTLANNAQRFDQMVFDLTLQDEMKDLIGRLVIGRPKGRRNYVHLAMTLDPDVLAIQERSILGAATPVWREMVLTTAQLRDLPREWAEKLAEWRGVYLIVDQVDGQRYVGSAYGKENLLGRWRAHVAREVGVTAELGQRPVDGFRFSILERVGPDDPVEKVVLVENNWKDRLHTKMLGLNRN